MASSSVCVDTSHDTYQKPLVNVWLETIRDQLDIERRVDVNHYYYVKPLRQPDSLSVHDCLYYSECENYDRTLREVSEEQVKRQQYRDSLLIRDLEIKSSHWKNTKYLSQHVTEENNEEEERLNIVECETLPDCTESLYFGNDKRKCVVLDDEHYEQLFNAPHDTNTVVTEETSNMQEPATSENTPTSKVNTTEQCIGQVVIRMNELGDASNRLSLNLLFDKNFLDLCKHISTVSTKTNEQISCVDKSQLTSATSIEMTIPTDQSGDIDIDISLDQTESSCESRNSNYASAVDLEEKLPSTEPCDAGVTLRNRTWVKHPRAKSLVEDREDVTGNFRRSNRASLYEYSGSTPFFFPSSSFVRRQTEQFVLDSEDHLQQTIGLPGFDECGLNFTESQDTGPMEDTPSLPYSMSGDSSPASISSDMASYESFTANDSACDYNTLDSRMMDITSHTFETLLFIPRQAYPVEDSLSDVTCSHFSSMENITRDILRGNMKSEADAVLGPKDDKDVEDGDSISSDVAQWMKDIFHEALDDSDEDWRPEWFSNNDREGRVYFFEENSSESVWTLPPVNPANPDTSSLPRTSSQELDPNVSHTRHKPPSGDRSLRNAKARSMILIDPSKKPAVVAEPPPLTPLSRNWPQLWDGHMCVIKEGTLTRTKITEHGKRLKKNWATSHVVLTELFLLFYKDAKQFHAMTNGGSGGRPELCVDLNGALIDRGDKLSSRRHVFLISTVLTLQVLLQFESTQHADLWLRAIHNAIKNLPSGVDNCSRIFKTPSITSSPESSDSKKSKIIRSKSVKLKKEGSIEDLPASSAERQTKIKARLKKFFNRRPTMDHLVKKGIYKDEPAFGCYLEKVCPSESPRVPMFVQKCIQCIEKSEDNMKTDGLYRASGNLSQVQKIRLQVDQNNLSVLDEEEDVHVLAGALKLFFRELKEPLIPYHAFNKALKASTNHNRKDKLLLFRDIIRSLPSPNHDTFKFLLQHLLRVTKYKDFNRMHIPNLAIVFGPTLMWSEQESKNMALDFMQQNLVIECFLVEFDQVFR